MSAATGVDAVRILVAGDATPDPFETAFALALAEVRQRLGVGSKTKARQLFKLNAKELQATHFAAPPWLVRGLVRDGGILQIAGEPKTTKTWHAMEIALAVATGSKAFGEFDTGAPSTVAYFFAEDFGQDVKSHLGALIAGRAAALDHVELLHLEPRGEFIDLTRDEDVAMVVASCRMLGRPVRLLILDPLRDVHGADEDSSNDMGPVMKRVRLIGELLSSSTHHCTVGFVHHMGKSSKDGDKRRAGQKSRGSGAIHGSTDSGIYLEDLTGDGTNEFTVQLKSEVKGCRSAGHFESTLKIEDDSEGRSSIARWTAKRADPATIAAVEAAQDDEDDVRTFGHVYDLATRGQQLSSTDLRESVPNVPDKRARRSIARLLGAGRLVKVKAKVCIPKSQTVDREPS